MLRLHAQALSSRRGQPTPSNAATARRSARRMLAACARGRFSGAGCDSERRRIQRTAEQGPAGNDSHPDDRHHDAHRIDVEHELAHPDPARDGGRNRAVGGNRLFDLSRRPQSGSCRRRPAGRGNRDSPSRDKAAKTSRSGESRKATTQAKPVGSGRRAETGRPSPALGVVARCGQHCSRASPLTASAGNSHAPGPHGNGADAAGGGGRRTAMGPATGQPREWARRGRSRMRVQRPGGHRR